MFIKFMSLFTTILMVLSYLFSVSSIYADGENPTLKVSDYIKTKNLEKELSIPGTYKGEWSASIQIGKVMAGLEGKINGLLEMNPGAYPWGKRDENGNRIAYIEYTVTFPENVTLDETTIKNETKKANDTNITADTATSMFNLSGIKPKINGQSVTFEVPLKDHNWKEILGFYQVDGGANSERKIELRIPYSVKFNNEDDAKEWGKQTITAKGSFEAHAGSNFFTYMVKETYNTDESTTFVVPEYAPKRHEPGNPLNPAPGDLEADLLIDDNTGKNIITKLKTDKMNFVGAINVNSIKAQLTAIEKQYQAASKEISLKDLTTTFTAELTLPQELTFPEQVAAKLAGAKNKFAITSTTINGQTATVTLTLKDSDKITSFAQLKEAVLAVDDQLKVTLPGVTFKDTAQANTPYKVTGKITGDFSAKATNTATNNEIPFNFTWDGKQSQAGASATDPNEIALSVRYVEPMKLPGDILIGTNTEHDKVYVTSRDSKLAFTGTLDVTPVKEQLLQVMENSGVSPDVASTINISDYKSRFVATLTLPNELDFVNNPSVKLFKDNSKYKIIETKVEGKTITVTMTVKKEDVTTLADLVEAVNGMEDTLEVVVKGVKFNDQSRPDTNYTVRGTMTGYLTAVASKVAGNNDIPYYFAWEAEQSEEGADYLAKEGSKEITFSLKYTQPSEPSKPIVPSKPEEEPNKPVEPSKPVEPNKPSEEPSKPVEPTKPSEPVKPETPTETTKVNQQSELPNTGVKSNDTFYFGVIILLLAGTFVIAPKRNM